MNWTKKDLAKLKNRDKHLFEKLFRHYYKDVFNYLLAKTKGNKMVAEELLSDTFYSAFKSIPNIKDLKYVGSWLTRIAFCRLQDHLRKEYRKSELQESLDKDYIHEDNTINDIIAREDMATVKLALNNLKEHYKNVLIMKYIEKKSIEDIAKIIKKRVETVNSLLYRARGALKKEVVKLSEKYGEITL